MNSIYSSVITLIANHAGWAIAIFAGALFAAGYFFSRLLLFRENIFSVLKEFPKLENKFDHLAQTEFPKLEEKFDHLAQTEFPKLEEKVDRLVQTEFPKLEEKFDHLAQTEFPKLEKKFDHLAQTEFPKLEKKFDHLVQTEFPKLEGKVDRLVQTEFPKLEKKFDDLMQTLLGLIKGKQISTSNSPSRLNELGEAIAKSIHADDLVEKYLDALKEKHPDYKDLNAYRIQVICMDFALGELEEKLDKDERDRLEKEAFDRGIDFKNVVLVPGYGFRDALLNEMGMPIEHIDKHVPEAEK